jgi:hypothetical protein
LDKIAPWGDMATYIATPLPANIVRGMHAWWFMSNEQKLKILSGKVKNVCWTNNVDEGKTDNYGISHCDGLIDWEYVTTHQPRMSEYRHAMSTCGWVPRKKRKLASTRKSSTSSSSSSSDK